MSSTGRVSFDDAAGIMHTVTVAASSLYEAAALALAEFKRSGFAMMTVGPGTRLKVAVESPATTHELSVGKFDAWLSTNGRTPREQAMTADAGACAIIVSAMRTAGVQTACVNTESAMIDIVECALHASPAEWLFFRELRVGTGRRNGGAQRLDAFALNTLPHTAMKRVCYEVKTSRGDFLAELKQPLKRRIGMRYSNEFYFVTPATLVTPAEVPAECGLIETGFATVAEWKQLISRHAGFFNYDPDTRGPTV